MKLVDDAKDWWKWNSVHVGAAIAVLPSAWAALPDDLKSQIPEGVMPLVSAAMFAALVIARVRAQD